MQMSQVISKWREESSVKPTNLVTMATETEFTDLYTVVQIEKFGTHGNSN